MIFDAQVFAKCPACGDAYGRLGLFGDEEEGHETTCDNCEAVLEVEDVEHEVYFTLKVKTPSPHLKEPASGEAEEAGS